MKEKILTALKNKFKNMGFGAKAFEGVADYLAATITEEDQIDEGIAGVEGLLKSFQGEVDSRVGKFKKEAEKYKAELEKKTKKEGGDSNPDPSQPTETDLEDAPAWAKTLLDSNKKLNERLSSFEGQNLTKTRQQTLSEKIKDAPDPFKNKILKDFNRMKFESDEDFNEFLEETATDLDQINQEIANKGLGAITNPTKTTVSNEKKDQADIQGWAKQKVEQKKAVEESSKAAQNGNS